jgi:hypothetical protein
LKAGSEFLEGNIEVVEQQEVKAFNTVRDMEWDKRSSGTAQKNIFSWRRPGHEKNT